MFDKSKFSAVWHPYKKIKFFLQKNGPDSYVELSQVADVLEVNRIALCEIYESIKWETYPPDCRLVDGKTEYISFFMMYVLAKAFTSKQAVRFHEWFAGATIPSAPKKWDEPFYKPNEESKSWKSFMKNGGNEVN